MENGARERVLKTHDVHAKQTTSGWSIWAVALSDCTLGWLRAGWRGGSESREEENSSIGPESINTTDRFAIFAELRPRAWATRAGGGGGYFCMFTATR